MAHSNFQTHLILSIILFFLSSSVKSQDFKFDRITTENGLSQGTVNCIYQDSKGFIWIGTNDGLNCYNAYSFKVYKSNAKDSFSISGNTIVSIAEDSASNLWIATKSRGLNYYNRENNKFTRFQHKNGETNSIITNELKKVLTDKHGNIIIGTSGKGLDVFIPATGKFIHYKHQENETSLGNDDVFSIIEEGNGKFWIGSNCGSVDLFDINQGTFKKYKFSDDYKPTNNSIGTFLLKDQNNLWIGTNGNGLFRLNISTGETTTLNASSLNSNIITSIINYKNQLLIGADGGGINIYDNNSGSFKQILYDAGDPLSLINNAVYTSIEL